MVQVQPSVFQQVFDYANRANPYPLYAELRKTPVARQENGSFVVSTYWEILALLHDPRISSDAHHRPASTQIAGVGDPAQQVSEGAGMLGLDPPAHDRLRRLAMRYFGPPTTPGRVDGMRPGIADLAAGLVDKLKGKNQIDVVDDFAYPLPVAVICDLLGVPPADEPRFHGWADAIVDSLDIGFQTDPAEVQRRYTLAGQASAELAQYMEGLIETYRRQPVDNFLSGLVTDDGPEGRMTPAELLETANLLLLAGHETTVNLITNGTLTLLRHPDILERLRREPELIIATVEELLRYEPPVQMLPNRTALTDITIAETAIPKGSAITLMLASANRDPSRFSDPDRFDPDRGDLEHLGFGSGIHNCFGAPMARLEAQAALMELVRRLENPRLVADPPPYRQSPILRGPRHLPVAIDGVRDEA